MADDADDIDGLLPTEPPAVKRMAAQRLAQILRNEPLFKLGGFGVTPSLDMQGGATFGSDRVDEGGNVYWRGMGLNVRPGLEVDVPDLGTVNAGVGTRWNASRVDLPKSLQELGAPEHVRGGTRGPILNQVGVEFLPAASPNAYSLEWNRIENRRPNMPADKRLMLNFTRKL